MMLRTLASVSAALGLCSTAHASGPSVGLDRCEVVVTKTVVDQDGGSMVVATYQDAAIFLKGVYDNRTDLVLTAEDGPIRGLICVRNDLVPTADDYAILATGIPLTLSQDFDSADSDLLTLYFADGQFQHRYNSEYPMSGEFRAQLETRLEKFSKRDHGLKN